MGWGMATAPIPPISVPATAQVRLGADGTVLVQSARRIIGTGTYTVMSQVAADTLGFPVERVRFELGDSAFAASTRVGRFHPPWRASAPAVLAACQAVRDKLFDLARSDAQLGWQNVPTDALRLQNGAIIAPGGSVLSPRCWRVQAGCRGSGGRQQRQASDEHEALFASRVRRAVRRGAWWIPISAPSASTAGLPRSMRGQVMNAKTAHSQLIGGITYGIGMALLEETHVDAETGRIVNANIAEYLVPVNADVPDIQAIFVANDERISNPLGVKGIGELPMVGVAAAIANAVYHATGVRVRDVPIRIEDVLV